MDLIEWIIRTAENIAKHGLSAQTVVISFMMLYNVRVIRKIVKKRIPKKFRISEDDRLDRVEAVTFAIAEHLGVKGEWGAPYAQTSKSRSVTDGQKNNSSPSWMARLHAIIIGAFTNRTVHLFRSKIRGESIQMKRLASRKLWMTILGAVIIVLNQQLGWHLNTESIVGVGSLIVSFILGQAAVDTNGLGQFAPFLQKLKSSKLWVSLIGSVVIILNDQYQWGMTQENIYMLVGLGVSFIIGKSAVSVSQAKKAEVYNGLDAAAKDSGEV